MLLKREEIAVAHAVVKQAAIQPNSVTRQVLSYFQQHYPIPATLPATLPCLEESLCLLLLTLSSGPNKSVAFTEATQQRHTAHIHRLPLDEPTLRKAVQPFPCGEAALARAVYFVETKADSPQEALGNPARILAERCGPAPLPSVFPTHAAPSALVPVTHSEPQSVGAPDLSKALQTLWQQCGTPAEREAFHISQQEQHLKRLGKLAQGEPCRFEAALQAIYSQTLDAKTAQALAARMSAAFQSLLQSTQREAGPDWCARWYAKQPIQSSLRSAPVPPPQSILPESRVLSMQRQMDRQADKILGAQHMEAWHQAKAQQTESATDASPVDPAFQKLWDQLTNSSVRSLVSLNPWLPESPERAMLYTWLSRNADGPVAFKQVFLAWKDAQIDPEVRQRSYELYNTFELLCTRLANYYSRHVRLDLLGALELWQADQHFEQEQAKKRTSQWRQSAASQYSKYTFG